MTHQSNCGGKAITPVVVLSPNLAGNATGRALVFVDLIRGQRPVVLAGHRSGPFWKPLEDRAAGLQVVDLGPRGMRPSRDARDLLRSGTVILIKPLFSSFGQWLLGGSPSPAVLDIDDPELALMRSDFRTIARTVTSLDGPVVTAGLLRLIGRVGAVTVSNRSLQTDPAMEVIPHARDERLFEPADVRSRTLARRQLGISTGVRLVVFVGTDRRHKGLDVLIRAAPDVAPARIVIVGVRRARDVPPTVSFVPPVSYTDAIRWLAAADVVAVPQLDGAIGRRQSPAKVLDAMAAGRAIVASDLPPIREMVDECARLVPAGSSAALAAGINTLLANSSLRESLEHAGRRRFLEHYSAAAVRPTLAKVLSKAEQ